MEKNRCKPEPEKVAVKNLLETWPTHEQLWEALCLPFPRCWVGLHILAAKLLGYDLVKRLSLKTDIDLFGGPLEVNVPKEEQRERLRELHEKYDRGGYVRQYDQVKQKYIERKFPSCPDDFFSHLLYLQLVHEGRLKWPPHLKEISALQVKRTGVELRKHYEGEPGAVLRPTLQNELRKFRCQGIKTAKMGFDRLAALFLLLGEPMPGLGFQVWNRGATVAALGMDEAENYFEPFFSPADPFARAYLAWGGVAGRDRTEAGGAGMKIFGPLQNSRLEEPSVKEARSTMVVNLEKIFSEAPRPTFSPVYLLTCEDKDKAKAKGQHCGRLFISYLNRARHCPQCLRKILPGVLNELKAALQQTYGPRFVKLILFGSWARGDEEQSSDVDLLLVLRSVSSNSAEIDRISKISSPVSLEYDLVFSVLPADHGDYEKEPSSAFFASVKKEGKTI